MLKFTFDDATKLRLKTVAKSKLALRCPKHTRYNPAHGRGAIVGRCQGCEAALEGYEAAMNLRQALVRYATGTERFETSKPRTRRKVAAPQMVSAAAHP
jgi:hypothetical protein